MELTKERRAGPKRIGELLVAANVVKPEVLLEALQVSKKSSTPLGRVLMTIGELTERDLETAIELQALLRESVISAEFGIRALNLAVKSCISLDDAFKQLGYTVPQREELASNELGQLLMDAGVVDAKTLDNAMRDSKEKKLPVGRCLVLSRSLAPMMLASALTAQVLLRDGKINREQAVGGLKAAARKHQTLETSLEESGAIKSNPSSVRVGDLLSSAGLVSEGDKISAVEVGLVDQKPVGQVLLQSGHITNQQLQESLRLQEMVSAGNLTGTQAAEVLKEANRRQVPIDVILNERNAREDEIARANAVLELLASSGLVSKDDLAKAENVSEKTNISIGEVLLNNGTISRKTLRSAVQAADVLKENSLKIEQVIAVLRYSHKTGLDFPEAMKEVALLPSEPVDESSKDSSWLGKLWQKNKKKP
jgi:hypothetical protein